MTSHPRRTRAVAVAMFAGLCALMWALADSTAWFVAAVVSLAALIAMHVPSRLQTVAVGSFGALCVVMWVAASRPEGFVGMVLSVAGLLAVSLTAGRSGAAGPAERRTPWASFDAATGIHIDLSGNGWLSRAVNGADMAAVLSELALSATQDLDGKSPSEHHRDAHILVLASSEQLAEPLCVVSAKLRQRRWLGWFGWARVLARQVVQSPTPSWMLANRSLGSTLGVADYSADTKLLASAFARVGARPLSEDETAAVHAWWGTRRWDDVEIVAHPDHLHLFGSPTDRAVVEQLVASGSVTWDDCDEWPAGLTSHRSLTFGAVVDFGGPRKDGEDGWIRRMLDQGVQAVSIRLRTTPAALTADQLLELRDESAGNGDRDRTTTLPGQLSRAEIRSRRHAQLVDIATTHPDLNYVSAIATLDTDLVPETEVWDFEAGSGPTLAWVRVGQAAGITIRPLPYRQVRALTEVQVGTAANVAPQQHQVPAERLAAGLVKGETP